MKRRGAGNVLTVFETAGSDFRIAAVSAPLIVGVLWAFG